MEDNSRLVGFIEELNSQIEHNYGIINIIFNSEYGYLALDPVRDEICKCFLCGLYQSTITLTNHLLEKSLKFSLATKYSIENIKDEMQLEDVFVAGISQYDNITLWQSIDKAYLQGLITENQKHELIDFKNKFRNPYSHANKVIFEGKTVKGKQLSIKQLENGIESFLETCFNSDSDKEMSLENIPFAQGIFQVEIAKEYCYPYFESVDNIIREMLTKIKREESC
jgi:hypothetical protein